MRADRALSGRLVCTSCGTPIGINKSRRKKIYNLNIFSLNSKFFVFIFVFIFAFILVII